MAILSRVLHHHSDKSPRLRRIALSPVSLRGNNEDSDGARFRLSIKLESPPIMLYGHANESSGSILSGVLTLEVLDSLKNSLRKTNMNNLALSPVNSAASSLSGDVMLDSVSLQLVQTFHMTKPFIPSSNLIASCKLCSIRKNILAEWDVSLSKCVFSLGSYAYPFSHLLPGLLTASSKLGDPSSSTYIRYELLATAKSFNNEVSVVLPLEILRSILRGPDKNSLRVFPPTEVVTSAVLPGVMYPKSTLPIELRMENIVNESRTRRWRMRKLLWKLEESTQVRAYACKQHQSKLASITSNQKLQQEAKALRGESGRKGFRGGFDTSNRISGMHHLTVQLQSFVSRPPSDGSGAVLPTLQELQGVDAVGNEDVELPVEDAPSNRISDEIVNFEEDFGSAPSIARGQGGNDGEILNLNAVLDRSANESEMVPPTENLYLDELRVVGHGDVKSGWKSDFLGRGRIELILDINILSCSTGTRLNVNEVSSENPVDKSKIDICLNDANVSCDINDPVLGVYVSHLLVVEMIVAEEQVRQPRVDGLHPVSSASLSGNPSTQAGVPTGAARVLRMQFKVILTERSGLGIAWDDEVPPTYHDVKALSPPNYLNLANNTPASLVGVSMGTPTVLYGVGGNAMDQLRAESEASSNLPASAQEMIQELSL